jgi:VWFA-related protein
MAPGIVSNRFVNVTSGGETHLAPLPSSLTVILLDGLNTAFTDQHYAKEALIKFLNQLQPGDRVAIYTLSNGLRVLHDFTSDTASLLAALAKHQNQDSSALSASSFDDANTGNDTLDAFLDQANERIANFYQARRIETTLDALETIAHHLAGMPGRKNLIWLSSSFPAIVGQRADGSLGDDFNNFTDNVQRALRTLNDIGVAIYPVDARGVISAFAAMPSMDASSRGRNPRARGPAPVDQRAQNQILQTQGTMRDIADRTGGRAFMGTNDLTGALRRAPARYGRYKGELRRGLFAIPQSVGRQVPRGQNQTETIRPRSALSAGLLRLSRESHRCEVAANRTDTSRDRAPRFHRPRFGGGGGGSANASESASSDPAGNGRA